VGKHIEITVVAVPTVLGPFEYTATVGSLFPENDYSDNTVTAGVVVSAFPVAGADRLATALDTPLAIDSARDLLANDVHPDAAPLMITAWDGASTQGGTVSGGSLALLYTPSDGFIGRDYFTYTVCDPDPECDQGTVSVGVGEWVSYLGSDEVRVDMLPLVEGDTPNPGMMPDYDGDGFPGLRLRKGGAFLDPDPTKRQWWDLALPDGRVMDQAYVSFVFWARVAGGASAESGVVAVGLYDCDADGAVCTKVADAHIIRNPWGAGTDFLEATISLGEITHSWAPGRVLRVALVVGAAAEADMDFGFDTEDYPSRLVQAFL
jgi:hypothetical protein